MRNELWDESASVFGQSVGGCHVFGLTIFQLILKGGQCVAVPFFST